MTKALDKSALDVLFTEARSHNGWLDEAVSDDTLRALYELWKYAPTSANCSPARVIFVRSAEAKARLAPFMIDSNRAKTLAAPVCAIIGYHRRFYDRIPELFPHNPEAKEWFSGDEALAAETGFRNSALQGAYLMLAARALGLDVGPMSGFDAPGVEQEFFPQGDVVVNFLCCLGKGDVSQLFPRSPRLDFDDACQLV